MQHVAGDMHMPRTVVAVVVERNISSCSVHRACSGHNWQVLSIWPEAECPGGLQGGGVLTRVVNCIWQAMKNTKRNRLNSAQPINLKQLK